MEGWWERREEEKSSNRNRAASHSSRPTKLTNALKRTDDIKFVAHVQDVPKR